MQTVAVIDYGMGNLHSVAKAVESLGGRTRVLVTADSREILAADRVIFPGVGAIRDCMAEIRRLGIDEIVAEVIEARPMLAVCVGMQALMQSSDENGYVPCIGLFNGQVRRFGGDGAWSDSAGNRLKVPHMGWNCVRQQDSHPLWQGIDDESRFYFVHSYYVDPGDGDTVSGSTEYGTRFAAALSRDNVFAVQFHPEKSQHAGLRLLNNFLEWDGGTAVSRAE